MSRIIAHARMFGVALATVYPVFLGPAVTSFHADQTAPAVAEQLLPPLRAHSSTVDERAPGVSTPPSNLAPVGSGWG